MKKKRLVIKVPVIFHESTICVYKVWFGDAFYIGSTINLEARMKQLTCVVLGCFSGKRLGNNSQTEIMMHLIEHPEINEGVAEVLEFADSEYDLVDAEKKWLDRHFFELNCLNCSDKTSRKINGVMVRPTKAIPNA